MVVVVASYRWYRSSHWLYNKPQRFEAQNILNVPNASITGCMVLLGISSSSLLWELALVDNKSGFLIS